MGKWMVAVCLVGILAGCDQPVPTYAETFLGRLTSARNACMVAIANSLDDPDSAKFENQGGFPVDVSKPGVAVAIVTLRAKNAFGAMRKFSVECTLSGDTDNWRLIELIKRDEVS